MGRRPAFFWALFLCTLATACAEKSFLIGVEPHEIDSEPVSTPSLTALQCFEGRGVSASDTRPLVVAVLSPRMVYSLLEWPSMAQEAERLGFRVLAWRDPRVPEEEWRLTLASEVYLKVGAPNPSPMPADCLRQWAPIDHLPLVRVLLDGRLHRWPIWGVMTRDAWRASLLNRLETLKREAMRRGSH